MMQTIQSNRTSYHYQSTGAKIAELIKERLGPRFDVFPHPDNRLEWKIVSTNDKYFGGFCWYRGGWMQICAPYPSPCHDMPFIPSRDRQMIRQAVWGSIAEVTR